MWAFLACWQVYLLINDGGGLVRWLLPISYSALSVANFLIWRTRRRECEPHDDPAHPDQDG